MSGVDVLFSRDIIRGIQGIDVIAHKRAISRARPDLYPWADFSEYAGPVFMNAVVRWKKSKGLGSTEILGSRAHEVLERTHAHNKPTEWAFDEYAIKLAQEYWAAHHLTKEQTIRRAIIAAAGFWYSHRWNIAYSQYRPMQLGKPPWVPYHGDCSAFATMCHYAGGAPDPNGRGYDHLGYTGTLMDRGERVSNVTSLDPGDLIFYGYSSGNNPGPFPKGSPTHVAVYAGYHDGAHMVYSLGSYPMRYTVYSYRHDVNHFRHYKVA